MNDQQKQDFVRKMGKRKSLFKGGPIKRENYTAGGAVGGAASGAAAGAALGSVIPGVGNAIGAVVGGIGGFINGLFGGGGPDMPNIVDPVTGQQITDATGQVVASQDQLQAFAHSLQGPNGVQIQQAVMGQLQDVASGGGPNPAKAMLAESTGANVANQAALMAGQRGASSNVGLIARQAGQQGANIQQQAAGQGATLQAEQSLNALNQEGALAGQVVGEQQNALLASNAAASANQANLLGAQGQYNTNITGGQGNVNTNNSTQQGQFIDAATKFGQGALSGLGAQSVYSGAPSAPSGSSRGPGSTMTFASGGKAVEGPHKSHVANFLMMSGGGKVPAEVSPGEISLTPENVEKVLNGASPLDVGEKIPGKAKVKGDSKKNDTVPRTLEDGGVVIPRSHAMSEEKAALFVHRAMAKKGRR